MSSKLFWICLLSIAVGAFAQSENATAKTEERQGKRNIGRVMCRTTEILEDFETGR